MKIQVCCMRDVRAGLYWNPVFVPSIGAAIRGFEDEVNRAAEDNTMYKHPQDFELFHLGTFDTESATFELFERPRSLCEGGSCIRQVPLKSVN